MEYFMPFFNEADNIKHIVINALKGMRFFHYTCLPFDMQLNFQYSYFKTMLYSWFTSINFHTVGDDHFSKFLQCLHSFSLAKIVR